MMIFVFALFLAFASPTEANAISLCGGGERRVTCVVDGDTFWFQGVKVRIADIDAPEISEPRCGNEKDRGLRARDRLMTLLNDGPFRLEHFGRDEDRHGRKLRVVIREGRSLGDQLVAEGLARTWDGARRSWCD